MTDDPTNGKKLPPPPWPVDERFDPSPDYTTERRIGLLHAEMERRFESVDAKLDRILSAIERQKVSTDDAHVRADAAITRTIDLDKRVAALEDVAMPIESAPKRRAVGGKKK